MTSGRGRLIALIGLLGTITVISVVLLLPNLSDGCMSPNPQASCPALADVNGVRYRVSGGDVLESISRSLSPFGTMSRTNVPSWFAGSGVMQVAGIDPRALLVGVAAAPATQYKKYLLLFGPDDDSAWPALCEFLPGPSRMVTSQC